MAEFLVAVVVAVVAVVILVAVVVVVAVVILVVVVVVVVVAVGVLVVVFVVVAGPADSNSVGARNRRHFILKKTRKDFPPHSSLPQQIHTV